MKTKHFTFILVAICVITLTSCDPKIKGCMNENAENYNADANQDDGNCLFEGRYIIWFGAVESYELADNEVEELNYFVDGQYLETTGAYSYLYEVPSCADELPVFFSRELNSENDTEEFTYLVTDQDDNALYSGTGTFEVDKCKKIELE
ncbi:MAG: hypothetical protein SH856_04075 [Flavobacteriales bacterium]|nr:hypothetical protein [Flavobacteriales bacterium]